MPVTINAQGHPVDTRCAWHPYPIVQVFGLGRCAFLQDNGPHYSQYAPLTHMTPFGDGRTAWCDWGEGAYASVLGTDLEDHQVRIMLKPV